MANCNEYTRPSCERLKLMNDKKRDIYELQVATFVSCSEMLLYFETEYNWLRDAEYRKSFNSEKLRIIDAMFRHGYELCTCEKVINTNYILENAFRCLRNACVESPQNQLLILNCEKVFHNVVELIENTLIPSSLCNECDINITRLAIQFLGNLCAGSGSVTAQIVFDKIWNPLQFLKLFKHQDHKIREYSSMLFYNCIRSSEAINKILDENVIEQLLEVLMDNLNEYNVEWDFYIVERFAERTQFWSIYHNLKISTRNKILDILLQNEGDISKEAVEFLLSNFKTLVQTFLNSSCSFTSIDPPETARHLRILCDVSVCKNSSQILISDTRLLELSIELLTAVHSLGKRNIHEFKPIQNLESLTSCHDEIVDADFYALKSYLIRLIANMCNENTTNQDIVRKHNGIELILDCCNLDARNPYIIQCCIFAMKILMKDNQENQRVLASISSSGEYAKSPILTELGIEVKKNP